MSHVQNLQHAVMAAKAGNPSLARVHLHKAAEEVPDDPAVWLWMGWLSESPISMVQCLEAAMQDERHHNIAQAGLAFARALSAYRVAPSGAGELRDAATAEPIELVEQLAADVAGVEGESAEAVFEESAQAADVDGWDPNGSTPPPLPPEASQPVQHVQIQSEPRAAVSAGNHSHIAPPPLPPEAPPQPSMQAVSPGARPHAASQGVVADSSPVWRAASSDWFTVDGSPDGGHAKVDQEVVAVTATPQPPLTQRQAPPGQAPPGQAPPAGDAWSQPAPPLVAPAARPTHPVPAPASSMQPAEWIDDAVHDPPSDSPFTRQDAVVPVAHNSPREARMVQPGMVQQGFRPSAAEQLDAELERHHVEVGVETTSERADAPVADVQTGESSAPVIDHASQPAPATQLEPWRPSGIADRDPLPYESPALVPGYATSYENNVTAPAGVAGPSFEGEPLKPATHPRTVLVVDDSPTVRKLVAMTLEKYGYRVVSAFDGVAAIREIAEHNPALILMDVNMPRMDGYQLCKLVRKHESTRHIPVLMLSGKDGVFDRLRGKMVGCSGYVPKPFVPEELVLAVGEQIGVTAR